MYNIYIPLVLHNHVYALVQSLHTHPIDSRIRYEFFSFVNLVACRSVSAKIKPSKSTYWICFYLPFVHGRTKAKISNIGHKVLSYVAVATTVLKNSVQLFYLNNSPR